MRYFMASLMLLAFLANSGCAIYEKETTNRGGYIDYVLDEHWLRADSKAMRALRAFAMQVSLARIASVSAKNESDRQLLAVRIGALTKRFLPIYSCAFNQNPLAVPGAETDPCFYYDSAMVDYSQGLFDLAMVALPVEDAQKLATAVTGSFVSPVSIVQLLNTLLQIGKDAFKYGRIVGALYRDTIELEVQIWLTTPPIDRRPPPYQVTVADVTPLFYIYASGNDNMPAWLAQMAALRARGLEPIPQPKFFYELGALMSYICSLITSDQATLGICKKGLPSPSMNPVSALGASVPFRIGDVTPPWIGSVPSQPSPRGGSASSQPSPKGGGASSQPSPSGGGATVLTSSQRSTLSGIISTIEDSQKTIQDAVNSLANLPSDPDKKVEQVKKVGTTIVTELDNIKAQINNAKAINLVQSYQDVLDGIERRKQRINNSLPLVKPAIADSFARTIKDAVQGIPNADGTNQFVDKALARIRNAAAG